MDTADESRKVFITIKILAAEGWGNENVFQLIRGHLNAEGEFEPDSSPFFKEKEMQFDNSLPKPNRILQITIMNTLNKLIQTHVNLTDLLEKCRLRKGGNTIITYEMNPCGTITLAAQAHPRSERALRRRGAQRVPKVHEISGHKFTVEFFTQNTQCSACDQVLCGFSKQFLQCRECKTIVHKDCAISQNVRPCIAQKLSHEFKSVKCFKPRRCSYDNRLMFVWNAAVKCKYCKVYLHEGYRDLFCQTCLARAQLSSPTVDDYDYYDYANYEYPRALLDPEAVRIAERAPRWLRPTNSYRIDNFNPICLLGQGSFGKVFLANFIPTIANPGPGNGQGMPQVFALKAIRKDKIAVNLEVTQNERNVLQVSSRSPFLLHMFCTFQTESHFFYVVDFVAGGALIFHLNFLSENGYFDVERARFYAAEVVCALGFLHERRIIYRDLKCENVMLDLSGHIRLIDFGLSKLDCDGPARTICGTPSFMAPEIVSGQPYSYAVDWWSFGAFLYQMLVGQEPFITRAGPEIYQNLAEQYRNPSLPCYDQIDNVEAVEILKLFLDRDPEIRLGSANCPRGSIREQPFFSQIDWQLLEKGEAQPPPILAPPPAYRRSCSYNVGDREESIDLSYFESDFINEDASLSTIDHNLREQISPNIRTFRRFSLTNVEYAS